MKSEEFPTRPSRRQQETLRHRAQRGRQGRSDHVPSREAPERSEQFAQVLDVLLRPEERRHALAELNDLLVTMPTAELPEAIGEPPSRELPALVRNLVAVMVEHASAQRGIRPPHWTRDVEPLSEPWFATPLPGLRLHLLCASPVAFRKRNLFVDSTVGDRT